MMRSDSGGFTYLGILMAVALMGIALSAAGTVWATSLQREREAELLFAGRAYRDAIRSYYVHSPGIASYPQELDELIEDKRFPSVRRHLRRMYADPITGRADWELMRDDAGFLIGVRSSSHKVPIKRANFEFSETGFQDADCYCGWQFVFIPGRGTRVPQKVQRPQIPSPATEGAPEE